MDRMLYVKVAALFILCVLVGCGKSDSSGGSSGGSAVGSTGAASSASVAQEIEQKIAADKDMAGAQVKIKEQNGTIQLDGMVKSQAQKDRAEQIVTDMQKEKHLQTGNYDNLLIKEGSK